MVNICCIINFVEEVTLIHYLSIKIHDQPSRILVVQFSPYENCRIIATNLLEYAIPTLRGLLSLLAQQVDQQVIPQLVQQLQRQLLQHSPLLQQKVQ